MTIRKKTVCKFCYFSYTSTLATIKMNKMQRIIISTLILILLTNCNGKGVEQNNGESQKSEDDKLEVLLFGTFHFVNYKSNVSGDIVEAKVPDVLTEENQLELEKITQKIKEFSPDKIFIEYPYPLQQRLDSIYTNFSPDNYFKVIRDEKYQIAFRAAKKLKHTKLYAMDIKPNFPFDSLMTAMKKAKQYDLLKKDSLDIVRIEKFENELYSSNKSLTEKLIYTNDSIERRKDINWYLSIANQGGEKGNFVGSYLASEWYRRNLYMYSIIQKEVEITDERIMILAGGSHIAMFKDFIDYNPEWKTIELKEIMNK